MALDHAALLEVLEAMRATGADDRVRTAAETISQALTDAELTAVTGPDHGNGTRSAPRSATALGPGCRPRQPVIWRC